MAILEKVTQDEHGLVGKTESGETVQLGIPTVWGDMEDYGYSTFEEVIKSVRPSTVEGMQVKQREEYLNSAKEQMRKHEDRYYLLKGGFDELIFNNNSFAIPYVYFERRK